jgi:hypothetical protein
MMILPAVRFRHHVYFYRRHRRLNRWSPLYWLFGGWLFELSMWTLIGSAIVAFWSLYGFLWLVVTGAGIAFRMVRATIHNRRH